MNILYKLAQAFSKDQAVFIKTNNWPDGITYMISNINQYCFTGFNQTTGQDDVIELSAITHLEVG
jgi:hypothetical protein